MRIRTIYPFFLFFSFFLLTACGHRVIPPEVSGMHFQKKPKIKRELIVLDAGHGGHDSGSTSKKNGYEEKELTLATTLMLRDCLKQLGYETIILTRHQDQFIPLKARAEIANNLSADLFVSVHYNYSANDDASGVEVFYYKENKTPSSPRILRSKQLGQQVLQQIVLQTGAQSRGIKEANFAVIRETHMPAILIEAGFLSNQTERKKIKDPKYMKTIAFSIAQGIDRYLENPCYVKK